MEIERLYRDLIEAYSYENLNRITGKLILLYKNKNHDRIREIAGKVANYVPIDQEKDAKCFTGLMMLYHPDKGEQFRKTIQRLYEQNDVENLKSHSHILTLSAIESVPVDLVEDDIDYHPEYVWDVYTDDVTGYADPDDEEAAWGFDMADFERSFYNMVKLREYGNVNREFPSYYLEDIEEFELAYCGMETLDGVEYCLHIRILDVSNNLLSDLENLWNLRNLEELYLANNEIGYIDALSNLINLRIVDLSGNQIDDITPLLKLENLEYVNLIDNYVTDHQINLLKSKGVIVMTEKVKAHNRRYTA